MHLAETTAADDDDVDATDSTNWADLYSDALAKFNSDATALRDRWNDFCPVCAKKDSGVVRTAGACVVDRARVIRFGSANSRRQHMEGVCPHARACKPTHRQARTVCTHPPSEVAGYGLSAMPNQDTLAHDPTRHDTTRTQHSSSTQA